MPTPSLIGLDWGSTSLRAYMFASDGAVLDQRSTPLGVLNVENRDFAGARTRTIGEWLAQAPGLPLIASGMIGSTVGWRDVPYVACPAGPADIALALAAQRRSAAADGMLIVPGLNVTRGPRPDVMRGEETQLIGALTRYPHLASGARVVMPGTHSKWVSVASDQIGGFTTYMTGELFAVLRDHSILGRPASAVGATAGARRAVGAAFERGVGVAREAEPPGVAAQLFTARTRVLAGEIGAADSLDYLSGLLIGDEIRSGLAAQPLIAGEPLALIGEAALVALYARALESYGIRNPLVIEDAATAGLWRLAVAAGIVEGRERNSAVP